jgi:hypothetical protein
VGRTGYFYLTAINFSNGPIEINGCGAHKESSVMPGMGLSFYTRNYWKVKAKMVRKNLKSRNRSNLSS